MIEISALTKKFNDFAAVSNLTFSVQKGEIFGFLGPNGAGKTTTIKMLMGILVPTSGNIKIDTKESHLDRIAINRIVGYLPDAPIFYDFLKGREILQFAGEMHGQSAAAAKENAKKLLKEFALENSAEEFAVNYSMGMKKKLGLACALIHSPQILILDEPTNGLDPRAAKDVQNHLVNFAKSGGTVMLSTHLLDMAQKLCHRVGVIHKGNLVAIGPIADIKNMIEQNSITTNDNTHYGNKNDHSLEDLFLTLTKEE